MTRAGGIAGTAGTGTGAGGRGAAAYLDAGGSTDKDRERIRKQLESSSDRENLDAMRLVGVSSNVLHHRICFIFSLSLSPVC